MAGYADHAPSLSPAADATLQIFLCGDVMLGRGIDQVLPHPCSPELYEGYAGSALDYVRLAEQANGPIPSPVDLSYVWGDALDEFDRRRPDVRIINLETSITRSDNVFPKGINYRMSPENAGCLTRAAIDCCVLANNHVLDWGRSGLLDTLATLDRLGIKCAGAGRNVMAAREPAAFDCGAKNRVLVFSFASATSGVPHGWAAKAGVAGINLLADMSEATVSEVAGHIARTSRPGDIIVASIHWGPNWGYEIADAQRRFAHGLIDRAGVSIVHGHSSHHAKAIEIYRDRLIIYGCGDFLNDYEGITGYEEYRDDLAIMYFARIARLGGDVAGLDMAPLQIRRFRLNRASDEDVDWLVRTLDRGSQKFGVRVMRSQDGTLKLS
jgi:poly-gamma-glutamate capsule biosynthesis protein CapA/YwtB (metallophosphatase superfamily)